MLSTKQQQLYYQALLQKNSQFEGLFYVGVKTTGVFCRPTCSARKPKFTNCEFFETAKAALLASFDLATVANLYRTLTRFLQPFKN